MKHFRVEWSCLSTWQVMGGLWTRAIGVGMQQRQQSFLELCPWECAMSTCASQEAEPCTFHGYSWKCMPTKTILDNIVICKREFHPIAETKSPLNILFLLSSSSSSGWEGDNGLEVRRWWQTGILWLRGSWPRPGEEGPSWKGEHKQAKVSKA